jgi:dihydrofolate reductase
MASNRVIGRDNALPWRLPIDMQHFMKTTMGKPVIMGRRTFESMKAPLAGRTNIVLTRETGYARPGIEVVHDLDAAITLGERRARRDGVDELMVIGGAAVYEAALPRAERLHVTLVDAQPDGDTFFPEIDWAAWYELGGTDYPADGRHAHAFRISIWERR